MFNTICSFDISTEFQEEGEDCGDCLAPSLNFDCGTCATGLTCKRDERLPDAPGKCTSKHLKTYLKIIIIKNELKGHTLLK